MENSLRAQLQILGLDASRDPLTVEKVNNRFKDLAKECHPDRYPTATADMKRQLGLKFAAIQAARDFFMDWFESEYQNFDEKQLEELESGCYDWANEALFQREYRALTGSEVEGWMEKELIVRYCGRESGSLFALSMPICKWNHYAPVLLKIWQNQHPGREISSNFECPLDCLVDLENLPLSRCSFWTMLMNMITDYEKPKAEFFLPVPLWMKFYSVLFWSTKKYAVGLARFLINLDYSDELLVKSLCGDGFGYMLHPEADGVYGSIVRDCLAKKRISAAKLLLGRLHLLTQFPDFVLKSYDCVTEENRRAFKLTWRGVVRKEKFFIDQRKKRTEIVRCPLYQSHYYEAMGAADHLDEFHAQEVTELGWRGCAVDSRCIWNTKKDPHHFLRCPYRKRPILEDTKDDSGLQVVAKPTVWISKEFIR